jgi:methionyl-tRNA formyltransferase
MGEMVSEVLQNPDLLDKAKQQTGKAYYYPQRKPEDGYIDWTLPQSEIWAQCRALTKPYPGLRSLYGGKEIIIWNCRPFDDKLTGPPGEISFVFEDTSFLVNCRDGRVIVELFECTENIALSPGGSFSSVSSRMTMLRVMNRHQVKYPNQELARRILNIDAG